MQDFHQPLQSTMEDSMKEAKLKLKIRQTEDKVRMLTDKYIEAEAKYPEGHFRRESLYMTLQSMLQIKEVTDTILETQESLESLVSAISLIDDSMRAIDDLMTIKDEQRHTIFTQLKGRRKVKKFVRNHYARMRSVCDKMGIMSTITTHMQYGLERVSLLMKKNQERQNKRLQKQKKASKGKEAFTGSFMNVSVENAINERKMQRGMDIKGNPPAADSSYPTPPSSGKKDDYNIDDII